MDFEGRDATDLFTHLIRSKVGLRHFVIRYQPAIGMIHHDLGVVYMTAKGGT